MDNLSDAKKALDLGEETGVKIMFMCNELRTKTDSCIAMVKDHPALYGYFLRDEPWCSDFAALGEWAGRIKKYDNEHMIYLNLYPSYVDVRGIGAKDYKDYVEKFISEVDLPMISFDNYPVVFEGVRQAWYENLEIIRECAREHDLPFWAFALSTPHWTYPEPTMASLRIQQYTNLAYGAAGLQYFTYWCPQPHQFDFHDAPIRVDGSRSQNYDKVKILNKEILSRAGVFVGSEVVSVCHTGDSIPPKTTRLTDLPEGVRKLDTHGAGAVVSELRKDNGTRYMMVVNRSIETPLDLDVEFSHKAYSVDREGRVIPIGRKPSTIIVEPGDAAIFRLKK